MSHDDHFQRNTNSNVFILSKMLIVQLILLVQLYGPGVRFYRF